MENWTSLYETLLLQPLDSVDGLYNIHFAMMHTSNYRFLAESVLDDT